MTDAPEPSPTAYACPHCGQPVPAEPGDAPQEVQCHACGGMVLIPAIDGSLETETEEEHARLLRPPAREDELDGLKIRNITVGRRALIRARTYTLVAALGCLFAVIKGILAASDVVRARGWGLRPGLYLAIAVAAALGILFFGRRLYHLHQELARPPEPDPNLPPPDFSTLSDGSQQWKNLDQM